MAERDLQTLLSTLKVTQHEGDWQFLHIDKDASSWADLVNLQSSGEIAMLFIETEGSTVIKRAPPKCEAGTCFVWLELSVYSDLHAVGFLAKIADALAQADVPCNAVAAYRHDHIFVPVAKADAALAALEGLAQKHKAPSHLSP